MTNLLLYVFMETSLLNYSSQGVSKLPGLGYTDMQEFCMHALNFTSFTYWQRTTLAAGRCYRGRGLIDSTAESASYIITSEWLLQATELHTIYSGLGEFTNISP